MKTKSAALLAHRRNMNKRSIVPPGLRSLSRAQQLRVMVTAHELMLRHVHEFMSHGGMQIQMEPRFLEVDLEELLKKTTALAQGEPEKGQVH